MVLDDPGTTTKRAGAVLIMTSVTVAMAMISMLLAGAPKDDCGGDTCSASPDLSMVAAASGATLLTLGTGVGFLIWGYSVEDDLFYPDDTRDPP